MRLFIAILIGVILSPAAWAQKTQAGLQVSVAPKTVSRNDTRYAYYFTDTRINRIMALQIVAKNVSNKAMPEGKVHWKILVINRYGTTPTLYSGSENLPALKTAASTEFLVGSAQITGWRDASFQQKDKLEHQITFEQQGQKTAVFESTPQFDTLAKHANKAAADSNP